MTRTPIGLALAGLTCTSVLLAGCGSSGSPAGGTAQSKASQTTNTQSASVQASGRMVDACTLLTKAEVHAVVGGTVSVKRDNTNIDVTGAKTPGCDFNVAGSVLANYASVVVIVEHQLPNDGLSTPVSGVGDQAFYSDLEGDPVLNLAARGAFINLGFGSDTQVAADKQQLDANYPADMKALTIALGKDVAARV